MIKNPITGNNIPKGWRIVTVDSIKSTEKYSCVAGPFGSDISSQYFTEEGVPVIRGNNLSMEYEKFIDEGFVFVSNERAARYRAQHVKANDLVFTCWGTIGQVGIIPHDSSFEEYIISNKQLKLTVNKKLVNPLFLYYYFSSPAVIQYLNNIAIGSAVPGINLGILKKIPIGLPPRTIQDKITQILEGYYELIENNTQRIALLEQMAEEIYKEWFVRLRFPGYEEVPVVDGLPEGWERVKAEKLYNINIGKTPPRNESQWFTDSSSGIKWVSIRDINNSDTFIFNTNEGITEEGVQKFNMNIAPKDTVIVSFKLTVGRVAILPNDMVTNEAIAHFNIKENSNMNREYTYCYLKNFQYGELGNTSSIGTAVNSKIIKNMPFIMASKSILELFGELIAPILEEIKVLSLKNENLKQTRDLLLPRLISGKLSVEHLVKEPQQEVV